MARLVSTSPAAGYYFTIGTSHKITAYFDDEGQELDGSRAYCRLRYSDGSSSTSATRYDPSNVPSEETYEFTITFNPSSSYPIAEIQYVAYNYTTSSPVRSDWIKYYPYGSCSAPSIVQINNSSSASVAPETNATLSWQGASGGINNGISGYNVYRATSSGGSYTKLNSSLITQTAYTVTSPSTSSSYYYKVTAYGSHTGETSKSSAYATLTTTYGSPTAPQDLTISETQAKKGSTIRLSWTAPESAGTHNTLAGYKVYFKDGTGSYEYSKSTAADTRTATHAVSNESGVTRYFYVKAYGSISGTESPASNVVSVITKGGTIKYHDGTGWVECEVYYHNGSQWVECEVYYHDGSSWREVSS